jgi:predicted GNAT superfamily acetyltransferase
LVEVPADFQALKGADPVAARTWREGLRDIFPSLFAQGYAVIQALRAPDDALFARCYYLVGPADQYLAGHLAWERYVA